MKRTSYAFRNITAQTKSALKADNSHIGFSESITEKYISCILAVLLLTAINTFRLVPQNAHILIPFRIREEMPYGNEHSKWGWKKSYCASG